MRRKVLHTIVVTLVLAAMVCAECPGTPMPMPIPPTVNSVATTNPGSPWPMPIPPIANSVAATNPGSPWPMPIPPVEVHS